MTRTRDLPARKSSGTIVYSQELRENSYEPFGSSRTRRWLWLVVLVAILAIVGWLRFGRPA